MMAATVSILAINPVSWIGGAEGALLDMITALDPERFKSTVVCPEEGEFPDLLRRNGISVGIVPFYGLKARNPLRYFETIHRLAGLVREHRADLVHVNHQYFANYGVILGGICRKPVVVHLRGVVDDEFFDKYARHIASADAVICVSDAARNRLLEYASMRMPSRRVKSLNERSVTIHDGFRPAANGISPSELRSRYDIAPEARVVGIVGQVTPEKGLNEFVEAAEIVLRTHVDTHFLIVGADPDSTRLFDNQLKATLRSRGLGAFFTFTGFVRDAAALISGMDVSVLASHQDAFPRVVIESLSAGVPVVATRVGGVPEIVEDGVSGLLVPPKSASDLARAIIQVLEMSNDYRQQLATTGMRSVARFSIQQHTQKVQELYMRLLS